jgi:membrane fusion protein, adhesin transport system
MKLFWFFGSSDTDDQREDLSGVLRGSRWALWSLLLTCLVFFTWAYFAEIDQITRAPGSVISSARSQIIQSQDGGVIEEMMVREGDVVQRDQVLVKIDGTRQQSSYLETRAKAAGLAITVARLQAEVLGREPRFPPEAKVYPEFRDTQTMLFTKRQSAIKEELQSYENIKAIVQKELNMTRPLLKTGDVSATEVLRLERQIADTQSQITNRKNKYFQDTQAELSKALEDLAGVEQIMAQRKDQLTQTELRAPLHGIVKNVRVTTRGGVIRPGEEVMQIVPLEEDLVIEAKVSPADIAFIKTGMKATVKIDAYDYTIYGDLSGTLSYISPDTLTENLNVQQGEQPYYRVQVKTDGRKFSGRPDQKLDIQPGMTSMVEIKTGSNTVLKYLSKPVIKTLNQSLGER